MGMGGAAACAAVAAALVVGGATAADAAAAFPRDGVISPGRVDPRMGPARAVGASFPSMVRAWGVPMTPARDIPVAFWPDRLEVTLTRAPQGPARLFLVTGSWWRTPRGIRPGDGERKLRRVYRGRLVAVADRRGTLGVRRHWMTVRGADAMGFVMKPGRVAAVISGRTATVREELRFAGPV